MVRSLMAIVCLALVGSTVQAQSYITVNTIGFKNTGDEWASYGFANVNGTQIATPPLACKQKGWWQIYGQIGDVNAVTKNGNWRSDLRITVSWIGNDESQNTDHIYLTVGDENYTYTGLRVGNNSPLALHVILEQKSVFNGQASWLPVAWTDTHLVSYQ